MIHFYKIDDEPDDVFWEVWSDIPGDPWGQEYVRAFRTEELEFWLDGYRIEGYDLVIHEGEYDEYNLALSQ